MGHNHIRTTAGKNKKRLQIVVVLTTVYLVAEILGGIWTGSLALLADAGHMLTDVIGLLLALFAIWIAERPANPAKTYGYYRAEILAALINSTVLIGISFYILYEAFERFRNPPDIASKGMFFVAIVGLIINFIGMYLLRSSSRESLNMKGAYFEVLSDMLTSVGVIIAAGIMWVTGWYYADPIISAGIGLFILPRTWILMKEAVGVLLEGTPSHLSLAEIRQCISSVPGVVDVHELHVWSLTSGVNALTAHVVRADAAPVNQLIIQIHETLKSRFSISHTTLQVEDANLEEIKIHN